MKTVTPIFFAHLQSAVTSLCTCWLITAKNGTIKGFTDNETDLVIGQTRFASITAYTATAVSSSSDFSVDNLEVQGQFYANQIEESDMRAGTFDGASVAIFLVNKNDPESGRLKLRVGNLGQVKYETGKFSAELRGLVQAYTQQIVDVCSMTCRASLGDSLCKVDLAPYTFFDSVHTITDNKVLTGRNVAKEDNYFTYGQIHFIDGACEGLSMEVIQHLGGQISLLMPMPATVQAGDSYRITRGCARDKASCVSFKNILNFRGEPDVPDPALTSVPAGM